MSITRKRKQLTGCTVELIMTLSVMINIKGWIHAPEISCIYIGEDIFYDEITEEQANEIVKNLNL